MAIGRLVERCWRELPGRFVGLELDEFVVMPNHVHGILVLHSGAEVGAGGSAVADVTASVGVGAKPGADNVDEGGQVGGARLRPYASAPAASAARSSDGPRGTQSGSLGAIIQTFKSVSTRKVNYLLGWSGSRLWQRNYYEHVIRDERALREIRQYICDNPAKWAEDSENPGNLPRR